MANRWQDRTKFGKHTNPDTKVVINYDLIEIQPNMSNEEKIILLAKQINPSSPNKTIVKKFQNLTMNLKSGDRGYGVLVYKQQRNGNNTIKWSF